MSRSADGGADRIGALRFVARRFDDQRHKAIAR